MLRGLYTATTAMNTNQKKMDVITNNIANGNTVGYKKDLVLSESFPEVLIHKINGEINFSGREGFKGVAVNEDNGLYDLKTEGGFFKVQTPNGISNERGLKLAVNEEGYLSTYNKDSEGKVYTDTGYRVLGNRGPVYVGEGQLEINNRGQVLVDGNIADSFISFLPIQGIGTLNDGVRLDRLETNFEQGELFETYNDLDVAIRGKGFFQIETPEGLKYTRDGSFKLNEFNELVTSEGYNVLGLDGPIQIYGDKVAISATGEITVNEEPINQLNIIDIDNIKDLRKAGENLYQIEDGLEIETRPFQGQVEQGFLESSNVDTIKEMVEMMTMFRNYESSQKLIKAYDEILGKAVNDIGRV